MFVRLRTRRTGRCYAMVMTIELQVGGRLQRLSIASPDNVPDALQLLGFDPAVEGAQQRTVGDVTLRVIPRTLLGFSGSAELNEEGLRMLEEMRTASDNEVDRGLNGSSLSAGGYGRGRSSTGTVFRRGSTNKDT